MTRSPLIWAVAILMSCTGLAAASEYTLALEPQSTEVVFTLDATGEDILGHLYLRSGEIRFDPETGAASGLVEIDALKTDTGNKKRDKKMHKSVLESVTHPLITFEPEKFEGVLNSEGPSEVKLTGVVTLLGAGHPMSLVATVDASGDRLTFESQFVVPYVAWGLHDPSWFVLKVAKEVAVTIASEGALSSANETSVSSGSH